MTSPTLPLLVFPECLFAAVPETQKHHRSTYRCVSSAYRIAHPQAHAQEEPASIALFVSVTGIPALSHNPWWLSRPQALTVPLIANTPISAIVRCHSFDPRPRIRHTVAVTSRPAQWSISIARQRQIVPSTPLFQSTLSLCLFADSPQNTHISPVRCH